MYSMVTGAAAVGVNRSTILRAIKAGKLSAERDGSGEAYTGGNPAAGFVGLGPRQDAEGEFARTQGRDPRFLRDQFAARRQDRRHRYDVLLLDVGVSQRIFKCGQEMPMGADALGQEHAFRNGKHGSP